MGNLIKNIKEAIAKSGTSKKDILYFAADSVHRVRFLQELEDGEQFQFHSDFNASVNALCEDPEDHESCPYCQDEIKLVDNFAWTVWDYDSNSVKILRMKASGVSPVPALIEMYEEFGTIMDRDYKIKKVGKGTGGSYVVTPLDKEKFTNKKAKAYTRKQMEEIFMKAYNTDEAKEDDDEEEDKPSKKKSNKKKVKKGKSLKGKILELDFEDIKNIAKELGMSKKELKAYDDEEELTDELFDSFEENDIEDVYNEYTEEDDDDEDDED